VEEVIDLTTETCPSGRQGILRIDTDVKDKRLLTAEAQRTQRTTNDQSPIYNIKYSILKALGTYFI
jgi:hypothetical protein